MVPLETSTPFTVELALLPLISYILFLKTFVVVAPVTEIAVTADAPTLLNVLMVLPEILIVVDVFEQVIPVTAPPVPVDVILLIVFPETVTSVAALDEEPSEIAVMEL